MLTNDLGGKATTADMTRRRYQGPRVTPCLFRADRA